MTKERDINDLDQGDEDAVRRFSDTGRVFTLEEAKQRQRRNGKDQTVIELPPRPTSYVLPDVIMPRSWLYGGHYIRGVVTATVAPGGFGKTTLSLFEAITMVCAGLRIWYISGEDPKVEIDRRIAAHCKRHGVTQADLQDKFFVDDRLSYPIVVGHEGKNQSIVFDEAQLASFESAISADKIDVAIFDPFIGFHTGGESNLVMDQIIKRLAKICVAQKCCVEISHHVRKPAPGQIEITVDDARGGGALVNAVRSCRVINRMSSVEAERANGYMHADQRKITDRDRSRYLRIDNGKRNMAPPEDARWWHIASIMLDNGDNVQAIEAWEFPKAFDKVSIDDQDFFRQLVRTGNYRADSRSPDWLGLELAKHYERDPNNKADVIWINTVIRMWIENGVFKKVERRDGERKKRLYFAPMDAPDSDEITSLDTALEGFDDD